MIIIGQRSEVMRCATLSSTLALISGGANALRGCGGSRVDHPVNFADFVSRETGHLRVLPHNRFVFGHVDTENLILRYVGILPTERRERAARVLGSIFA